VDSSKCNGCTLCIAKCPGLATFVGHNDFSKTEAMVALPYELLPRPQAGASVGCLGRAERTVCKGRVVKELDIKTLKRCAVVTVALPTRHWNPVRSIRVRATGGR
jgi:Fe-S-cluster-containing hydrogenase component 2